MIINKDSINSTISYFLNETAHIGWLLEVLGLVVVCEEMELKLMPKTHHCRSLFYNMRNAVPRFCTCISYGFQTILQCVFACQKNVTFTCLSGIMLMNLRKDIKKLTETRWGRLINSLINECQQLHIKKILQFEKSKSEKNRSRRCRKIVKSNSLHNFLLKDKYWFDVSIISKSPNNDSILKKRGK